MIVTKKVYLLAELTSTGEIKIIPSHSEYTSLDEYYCLGSMEVDFAFAEGELDVAREYFSRMLSKKHNSEHEKFHKNMEKVMERCNVQNTRSQDKELDDNGNPTEREDIGPGPHGLIGTD